MKRIIILFTLLIIGGASACSTGHSDRIGTQTAQQEARLRVGTEYNTDDGVITDAEFLFVEEMMAGNGDENYWTHGLMQTLSESACRIASELDSLDELVDQIGSITQSEDDDLVDMSYRVGVIMATTCLAEFNRLAAAS